MDALSGAVRLKPDVVLLDLRLPDGNGVDLCREILGACPQTRVLFLTAHDDDAELAATVAGAQGYLLKEIGAEELIERIKTIAGGRPLWGP